jgi:Tol biopolymer transport system component
VSLATGEQQKVVQMADKPSWAPWRYSTYDLSPDGTTLAFPRETSGAWRLHFANPDGSNVRPAPQPGTQQVGLDWSPDGKRLLWADGSAYHVWDLEREQVSGFSLQPDGWAAFAPDGRSVVYEHRPSDNEKTDLYVVDLHGRPLHRLTYHPANDRWADWWAPKQ